MPTGSFMIYGKRNWVRRIPVKIAIGVKDDEVIFGPEAMVKKKVSKYVTIVPGDKNAHEIGIEVKSRLKTKIETEKIAKVIPYRKGHLPK